ncbi:MAG TPA: hypothetical protein EYN66_08090, partial [Myxococcales bacterium]|nr:hypothetical protein [Myxococcales bacterium]
YWAHHGAISPDTVAGVFTRISLVNTYVDYHTGGERGSWRGLKLMGEYAPLKWLSVSATVPLAHVVPNDSDKEGAFGLSDMEVGARVLLVRAETLDLRVRLGLDAELPTGDDHDGLGGGHVSLIPHLSASIELHPKIRLKSDVRFAMGLGDYDHVSAASHRPQVVGAHGVREFAAKMDLILTESWGFMSMGGEFIYGLEDPKGQGPIVGHVEVGSFLTPEVALVASVAFPTTDEQYYVWRSRVGLTWLFGGGSDADVTEPGSECGCDFGGGAGKAHKHGKQHDHGKAKHDDHGKHHGKAKHGDHGKDHGKHHGKAQHDDHGKAKHGDHGKDHGKAKHGDHGKHHGKDHGNAKHGDHGKHHGKHHGKAKHN